MPLTFLLGLALLAQQPKSPAEAARQVVDDLLAQKYPAVVARFSQQMKQALDEQKLREGTGRFAQFGPVKQILPAEVQSSGQFDTVIVPVIFEKVGVNIQVSFNKAGEVAGLFFRPRTTPSAPWTPPAYVKPDSFKAEEVTTGAEGWPLPGTLLIPEGKGRFPAVVLVHGSGPNDRDETVLGIKVFRDLAEGLASRGIAVLRYEKRTRQHAAKLAASAAFTIDDESTNDALAAVAFLEKRPEVDPDRIFVLGHSLGGYVIPRIGKRRPNLAGLVIMAGNTRPVEDLVLEQTAYIGSLQKDPQIDATLAKFRVEAQKIKDIKPGDSVPWLMGAPAAYWLDLKGYQPAVEARGLKSPLLILHGERDYQVAMTDFEGWKKELGASRNVTLKSYPALNHLFVEGEGKSTPAEYSKPGHVSAEVVADIANWILKRP